MKNNIKQYNLDNHENGEYESEDEENEETGDKSDINNNEDLNKENSFLKKKIKWNIKK